MPTFDLSAALVVVDVQNDFADPAGALAVPGGEAVVPVINELVAAAREVGSLVVYTQDWHPERTPHFVTDGGPWPPHCVQDTWGAALHPDLVVQGATVRKGADGGDGYSGFSVRDAASGETTDTELDSLLHAHGVQRLVVAGLATDYCVLETVLDARTRGYAVEVPADGVRPVDLEPGDGERALERMRQAGASVR